MKESLDIFCNKVKFNWASTSALSVNSDLTGITAKTRYVLPEPSQGFNLIQETSIEITNGGVSERGARKEAERWQTVVYWGDDNIRTLMDPMIEGPASRITRKIAL